MPILRKDIVSLNLIAKNCKSWENVKRPLSMNGGVRYSASVRRPVSIFQIHTYCLGEEPSDTDAISEPSCENTMSSNASPGNLSLWTEQPVLASHTNIRLPCRLVVATRDESCENLILLGRVSMAVGSAISWFWSCSTISHVLISPLTEADAKHVESVEKATDEMKPIRGLNA